MFQDLFSQMNQTLELLNEKFDLVEDIDQELFFLEKYLYVKEISEDLTSELNKFNSKLSEFENNHGLIESNEDVDSKDTEEEVEIELYEEDFMIFQRGIGYYDLWMYDKAIVQLENVIKKYPDFNLARLYTAMTYLKKKDYQKARQEILFLFKFSDDVAINALAHNILGMICGYIDDNNQAILHFKQAIELKDNWTEPKYNLAIIYYRSNMYVEAIKIFEELYSKNENDWEVLFYLGKSYQKINQLDIADDYYKKIYTITKNSEIIKQIANYFETNSCFQKAIFWYKKLLTNKPDEIEALIGLGKNTWLSGDKKTGISLVKKALCFDKDNIEGLLLYAWMLTDKNDEDKIFIVMDKLLNYLNKDTSPFDTYLVANLARLYYLNTDEKSANKFCALLQNADNQHLKALVNIILGLINLDKGKPELALNNFETAVKNGIVFPNTDFYIGYSHYLLGNVEDAKLMWNKM